MPFRSTYSDARSSPVESKLNADLITGTGPTFPIDPLTQKIQYNIHNQNVVPVELYLLELVFFPLGLISSSRTWCKKISLGALGAPNWLPLDQSYELA